MDIVSSHSWSHSNQKRRRSTSLSLKKPKRKRVCWTWFYHSPKIFVNIVNFQVFSIHLILVFDLKSCFYMCFNLFEWFQVEEISRKLKEKKSDRNRSKNRAKTELCEISQPKENFCEMSILLPNHSATLWDSLREFSQLRRQVWHTSATSQLRNDLRSGKAQISQQKSHSAGYFAIAKVILAHECHFAAQ